MIYKELLQCADHALNNPAHYLNTLDWPVLLLFYCDHVLLLKAFANPFRNLRTDSVIIPIKQVYSNLSAPVLPQEEAPWKLVGTLLRYEGLAKM